MCASFKEIYKKYAFTYWIKRTFIFIHFNLQRKLHSFSRPGFSLIITTFFSLRFRRKKSKKLDKQMKKINCIKFVAFTCKTLSQRSSNIFEWRSDWTVGSLGRCSTRSPKKSIFYYLSLRIFRWLAYTVDNILIN